MKSNLVIDKVNKKKEQGLATKQDIMAAAEEVLFERGAAATTLEQIAERANVTRGAIYWHFKNKNELLEQIIDNTVIPFLDSFRTALEETAEASIEHLHKSSIEAVLTIVRSSDCHRRLAIALLKCEYTPEFQYLIDRHTRYHDEAREMLVTYLRKIEAHTGPLSKSPEIIAEALLFYNTGILTHFFRQPDKMDLERYIMDYFDIFFLSITSRPGTEQGRTSP